MAPVTHALLDSTLTRIRQSSGSGLLVGYQAGAHAGTIVLDVLHIPPEDSLISAVLSQSLPQGLSYVGLYGRDKDAIASLAAQPLVQPFLSQGPQSDTVLAAMITDAACQYFHFNTRTGSWLDVSVSQGTPRTDPLAWNTQPLITCSITLTVPLSVYTSSQDKAARNTAIQQAVAVAGHELQGTCGAFLVTTRSGKQMLVSGSTQGTVSDIELPTPAPGQTWSTVSFTAQPLRSGDSQHVTRSSSGHHSADNSQHPGPVYQYQVAAAGTLTHQRILVTLSALAYLPLTAQLSQLASLWLLPPLLRQLQAAAAVLCAREQLTGLAAHCFLPPGRSHHVTLLYPQTAPDTLDALETSLSKFRSGVHQVLGLPLDRPCLRVGNAVTVALEQCAATTSSGGGAQRLKDVHLGLTTPVPGGVVSMVDGSYDYHHYMQDRFNDNGWGCAYRSLQTLVSWFRHQQYTSKLVPTHREIQQQLVRVGDKTPDFVGTSNWIGAIELSYVLDEYLGVVSKIITVNRGADIPAYARQLAAHFQTQGTPIMIGGGVLAYTLLGVAFNEMTGDCAFLILDPHYTGGEDLKKIHSGSWVAWKKPGDTAAAGGPLFVQDAFYNFLCPQRPQMV